MLVHTSDDLTTRKIPCLRTSRIRRRRRRSEIRLRYPRYSFFIISSNLLSDCFWSLTSVELCFVLRLAIPLFCVLRCVAYACYCRSCFGCQVQIVEYVYMYMYTCIWIWMWNGYRWMEFHVLSLGRGVGMVRWDEMEWVSIRYRKKKHK
ncbi:hypothetical protein BDV06DRAFT_22537 [Aspergillus oleicola]